MKILKASHLGMCFGVRDAVRLALAQPPATTTILGDLVHNESVLSHLRSQGVQLEYQVSRISTPSVMITAHGASNRTRASLRHRGLNLLEATCPLVHYAHQSVQNLVRQGFHPVIIGRRNHVEVRGLTEDLSDYDVILSDEEVETLQARPRFGVAAQTTQPIQRVRHLVRLMRSRFPGAELRFVDTVCQPTKNRQTAAAQLARQCDVVVVIGGAHSNNTHELVATCSQYCSRVHHVRRAEDLHGDWFDPRETVGITAGTSTPDHLIQEVEAWLKDFESFQSRLQTQLIHREA